MSEEPQPTFNKKEERNRRRDEKQREIDFRRRTRLYKKILTWVIVVLLLGGGWYWIWRAFSKPASSLGSDFSKEYANIGREHIPDGSPHILYNSNPPTSGPHWANPVRDGIYDKTQPDEGLIHSLEHGRIWISYKPSIPSVAKDKLIAIAKSEPLLILTQRSANDTDIAVVAWQRLDTFNLSSDGSFDEKRIRDFITRYRDNGPERNISPMTGKEY